MKMVMRKKQASDIFYKIHGDRARAYTRETSEIRTRLDRIYAKDANSQLVWHSHKLDHTYVNYVDSDHIPVIVEAGPLIGESKSKKTGNIVKQIPEYTMQAAKGNITTGKKDNDVASKIYY